MYKVRLHDGRIKEFKEKEVALRYAESTQGVVEEGKVIKAIKKTPVKRILGMK